MCLIITWNRLVRGTARHPITFYRVRYSAARVGGEGGELPHAAAVARARQIDEFAAKAKLAQ